MKRLLVALLIILSLSLRVYSAETDNQVLVFGKGGVVTLMYADELKSISLSTLDTDSVEQAGFVTQEFLKTDGSVFRIALADIDSVAFGNRNKIVPKSGVHEILDSDLPLISSVVDNVITFKSSTTTDRLPLTDQYVYYIGFDELFPWGLCAKVNSVVRQSDSSVKVSVEDVHPSEVFDEFFFSGEGSSVPAKVSRAPGDNGCWNEQLEFDRLTELTVLANANLEFSHVVANVITGYYHADIDFNAEIGYRISVNSDDNVSFERSTDPLRFRLPPLAMGIIQPNIEVGAFFEAKAELKIDYEMKRHFTYSTSWTRRDGQNYFTPPSPASNPAEGVATSDNAKVELILEGSIFGGLFAKINLCTLFDHLGAGVHLRCGPELSGTLGFGALADMHSDHTKPIFDASVDLGLKLEAAPYWFYDPIFSGERDEHYFVEPSSIKFLMTKLDLFPSFDNAKAVPAKKQLRPFEPATKVCTAASTSDSPIPYPLETGYELVNTLTGQVADSVFTTTVEAFSLEEQGIAADLDFGVSGNIDTDEWQVRPIVRYGDYIVAAAPFGLNKGARLSPYTVNLSRSGIAVKSSFPAVGSYKADNRVFEWCGTPHVRKIRPAFLLPGADSPHDFDKNQLKGTWEAPDDNITLTFSDDDKGNVRYGNTTCDFTYVLTSTGEIKMTVSTDNITRFIIVSLDSSELTGYFKNKKKIITFHKI